MQDPSNTIGTIRESGWVAAAPWTPTATPPAVMFKFENTSTACAPEDDTALSEVLESIEAQASLAAEVPPGSGGGCYTVSDRGQGYRGQMDTTETGRACLRWGQHDHPGGGNIFSDARLPDMCALPHGLQQQLLCVETTVGEIQGCPCVHVCVQPAMAIRCSDKHDCHEGQSPHRGWLAS